MTQPAKSFVGKCPQCGSYNSRRCTEIINYAPDAETDPPPVVSRTRVYLCNACGHSWSETVAGDAATGR